jgi:hypothetical protein
MAILLFLVHGHLQEITTVESPQIRSVYPVFPNMIGYPFQHDSFQRGFNSYGVADFEFGRMNGDRRFSNRPRQAPHSRFHGRCIGEPLWCEWYVYGWTEQPHYQGQNVISYKAAPHQLRDPEKRGMKRDWCAAESSYSL